MTKTDEIKAEQIDEIGYMPKTGCVLLVLIAILFTIVLSN